MRLALQQDDRILYHRTAIAIDERFALDRELFRFRHVKRLSKIQG